MPFPLRFLFASQPAIMSQVLGIVYRALAAHLIKKAGFVQASAHTGAVTLIQRFGSALNLNSHFHMLFLDGVYIETPKTKFRPVMGPTHNELVQLVHTVSHRIARFLERRGLLVRDAENAYLDLQPEDESPMDTLMGHSITYRIATGPNAGRKVLTLQTLPAIEDEGSSRVASMDGFSLHAGVATQAHERDKLERVCRYIALQGR
ncbi:MAG: transposase [Nitrospinae bacterium]|nr:transposase [Nitrospinota bacterium]